MYLFAEACPDKGRVVNKLRIVKIFVVVFFLVSCGSNSMLKEMKKLDHYPSASGIEYYNHQFYIIGDDANNLLVLDSNLTPIDSISLYSYTEKRIPKAVKTDLEAVTMTSDNMLLVTGSGSSSPTRDVAWLIDPVSKKKDSIRLDTFYQRLKANGIKEINIEGVTAIPGAIILSNRGSKGYPRNHLIISSRNFWTDQSNTPITIILAGMTVDSSIFTGISGITYAPKSDRLLLTVSTEDTRNSMDDGAIGKSYLWIINNISAKKNWKAINPDQVIELEAIDNRFKEQKIESVCLLKETSNFLDLVLVADNDNGSSSIFRLVVEKK